MVAENFLKENQDIIQKLRRVPALESFSEDNLSELLRMSKIRRYQAGELIFKEGSYAKMVYYLVSGQARIVKNGKDIAVLHRTGDVFGEMGAIAGSSRSASVFAGNQTVCIEIDVQNLEGNVGENQYAFRYMIFRGFAQILATRLRRTTEALIEARAEIIRLRKSLQQLKQP